jgi:hypothetical protein
VRGTESLSAYYQKRYKDALDLARDGQRHAHGGPQTIRLAVNGEAPGCLRCRWRPVRLIS